ncbi:MAG: hypothetical protein V9G98_14255 [Candidatus Competibacter sp.]
MTALKKITDPDTRTAFAKQAEKIMCDAVRLQGVRALESTRRHAAIHEAGHAVIYEITADDARWWRPYRLRIWREPAAPDGLLFWAGRTDVSPKAPPERVDTRNDPTGAAVLALRALAGWASESQFCRKDFRMASSVDEMLLAGGCARSLATHWNREPEKVLEILIATATRMLQANKPILMTISSRLEQNRKLENAELRRLLAGVVRQP